LEETLPVIHRDRLTATLEGGFVVFLIGMRINRPLLVHKWWPVVIAMPRMLKELYSQPELGFIHAETWFSRTIVLVQYWRSMEQLHLYAKSKEAIHLPAWQAFNKAIGTDGSVGIWHETYQISPGGYENVYVNMPSFGLGRAGTLQEAKGSLKSASGRLGANLK
jgi:GH15 family glucan-1,4-alpha-glucosidase